MTCPFLTGKRGTNHVKKIQNQPKKREDYIYYTVGGTRIVISPGEDEVTEALIENLHNYDDAEVDEQRRYDYRVTSHLNAYHDGENEEASDRNKYLADDSYNPESILIEKEMEADHQELLERLADAMESLTEKEKKLFQDKFADGRTNVSIAKEMGISETMVRKNLKKMYEKLGSILTK